MKQNILFFFIQLLHTTRLGSSDNSKQLLSSPVGPYHLVVKQIYNCNPTKNNLIQHNLYVSHKGNSTLLLGNSTLEVPIDDTFFLEFKMAIKTSPGNWKENVFSHKVPNACSSAKKLMGKAWTGFINSLGSQITECPIPAGIYIAPGLNTSFVKDTNLPKTFIYGTYKLYMYYSRKNEKFGCQLFIIELNRP
ncbi:uncharacterized protein LOC132945377 [Metopolophium dirhodum]|uniref:uncharacterized protein LOC132945377 n=1 Tax=Metopolophium dirhodum TaxID=44670 RepID=UPI0029907FEA|nr:uncharacterized protein LOC132945377 [Metopolophium dirhodum]